MGMGMGIANEKNKNKKNILALSFRPFPPPIANAN
jgi:hypothetical protein